MVADTAEALPAREQVLRAPMMTQNFGDQFYLVKIPNFFNFESR